MGFANSSPSYNSIDTVLLALNLWTNTSDAAIISTEVPWDSLYAGHSVQHYIANNYVALVNFYRAKNLTLWVYIDPENGLNRASNSNTLVGLGKSIAQADVQKLYRQFVVAMDSMLKPDHLGLALETNLIRAAASQSIYQGVVQAVNAAAADVKARDQNVKLSVSIQAEVAWGKTAGNGSFVGIGQDLADFPFVQEIGISSYPYFNFAKPSDLPLNYYSNLVAGKNLPVFVSEGGWTAQSIAIPGGTVTSTATIQQEYMTRQSQLLDQAQGTAWFQLTFTDINLSTVPSYVDPTLKYFVYLGLVDVRLQPKPCFTTWKNIYQRTLK